MKKIFILSFLVSLFVQSVFAKAMTLSELKTVAEEYIIVKEAEIISAETSYAIGHSSRFLQCHAFCTTPPTDGVVSVPDKLNGPWNTLGISFGLVQCSFEIHECQDLRGNGFLLYVYIKTLTGEVYRKINAYNANSKTHLNYLAQGWERIDNQG